MGLGAIVGLGNTPAKADLVDPNVLLNYALLDFGFTRTAAAGAFGTVGTFSITDTTGSTMAALLFNDLSVQIDRADILDDANFNVSVTGDVIRIAPEVYAFVGSFSATDDSGNVKVLADFNSSDVSLAPAGFTHFFTLAGNLSTFGGGNGPILVDTVDGDWTFLGHTGDTPGALDVDGDSAIAVVDRNVDAYDTGGLVEFNLGLNTGSLDTLFSATTIIAAGNMSVAVVPAPAALGLGALGFSMIVWMRRRWS